MNYFDYWLDRITMYRLVLYYLLIILGSAVVFGVIGWMALNPVAIVITTVLLVITCVVTNEIFARVFRAPTNFESAYITALILACIISPITSIHGLPFIFWAGILAMASKYILAINKKHLFNPAAIAVVLTAYGINQSASWWVGTTALLPIVLIGGLLVVRKIQREDLVFSFFVMALLTLGVGAVMRVGNVFTTVEQVVLQSSVFFFGFVMLTEPLTTPPTKNLQVIYGGLVGLLFAPFIHLGSLYSTPELALCVGNLFSYVISPKHKLLLFLSQRIQTGKDMMDLVFLPSKRISYLPGQYMEWTLPHKGRDSRGNRRYFTLASSPTEPNLRLGVKFHEKGSSYKRELLQMTETVPIVASQMAGDFTLPKNKQQKLVFLAGGIGITPYRSMIKYLLDRKETRPIVLMYSNKSMDEIVYADVFEQARKEIGIKTVYTLTGDQIPGNWVGRTGRIDAKMITEEVPDFKDRLFYLSGPQLMVSTFEKTLRSLGIPTSQIKKDFFPGFV